MYPYNSNVPQSTQLIRATQQPIENNFQAINDWVNTNHVGFNDPDDYGKHNYTSLISQGSIPSTSSTEMVLFCASSVGSNPYELYYRYPNNGTVVQLTGVSSSSVQAQETGYCILTEPAYPGYYGYLMKWGVGNFTYTGTSTFVYTFPTGGGIPEFGGLAPSIFLGFKGTSYPNVTSSNLIATQISTTSFSFIATSSSNPYSFSIYWAAYGTYLV